MKATISRLLAIFVIGMVPLICRAQCAFPTNNCDSGVPHFVKLEGMVKPEAGMSRDGTFAMKFVIYDEPTSGNALWQEVQNIRLDSDGKYEVLLGATAPQGMPVDIFASGGMRWLSAQVMRPGSEEQPRVPMVSVPYAMEAADAQTLGGLPVSAFARSPSVGSSPEPISGVQTPIANSGLQSATSVPAEAVSSLSSTNSTSAIEGRVGPINVIPKFSGGALASSQITDAGGAVTMQNLANILFADQFAGGVPAAVSACPANGCIIYALSPNVSLNLGTIDPGTKAITIYLGPYTYTVKQIILRKALKIIGMGASAAPVDRATLRFPITRIGWKHKRGRFSHGH
jgi:hypothetical protein